MCIYIFDAYYKTWSHFNDTIFFFVLFLSLILLLQCFHQFWLAIWHPLCAKNILYTVHAHTFILPSGIVKLVLFSLLLHISLFSVRGKLENLRKCKGIASYKIDLTVCELNYVRENMYIYIYKPVEYVVRCAFVVNHGGGWILSANRDPFRSARQHHFLLERQKKNWTIA